MKAQINVTEAANELAAIHLKLKDVDEDSLVYEVVFDKLYDAYFDLLLSFKLNSSK